MHGVFTDDSDIRPNLCNLSSYYKLFATLFLTSQCSSVDMAAMPVYNIAVAMEPSRRFRNFAATEPSRWFLKFAATEPSMCGGPQEKIFYIYIYIYI